ncbi:ribose-5-phosphate isomerase rki1 [Lecanora helva]
MSTTASSDIESAKRNAAQQAVKEHFDPTAKYVGIGSGSTIVYVVEAIKAINDPRIANIDFVPTGYQSRQRKVIKSAGLKDIRFDSLPPNDLIDVAFDGADEIDDDLNCIKGGGACLYQEKLVATQAKKFICVADHRKLQPRLLTKWPTIPIEVEPLAINPVLAELRLLGSSKPFVREGPLAKTGPIKTDQDNFIVDAPFPTLMVPADLGQVNDSMGGDGKWEVAELERRIKAIGGVLEVGLFAGLNGVQAMAQKRRAGGQKPVAAYFGMEDGSVVVRQAKADGTAEVR